MRPTGAGLIKPNPGITAVRAPQANRFLARRQERFGEVLFIDARKLGRMVDRTHRELTDHDIIRIADTYDSCRMEGESDGHADLPSFCKSASLDAVPRNRHILTTGRYVGVALQEGDQEPFQAKIRWLVAESREQQAEGVLFHTAITEYLTALGCGDGAP